jgi:hypothetical protein
VKAATRKRPTKSARWAFAPFGRVGTGTDAQNRFVFHTVKPAAATPGEAPHINVIVLMRGLLLHAFTRVYFSDEAAANAKDAVLNSVPPTAATRWWRNARNKAAPSPTASTSACRVPTRRRSSTSDLREIPDTKKPARCGLFVGCRAAKAAQLVYGAAWCRRDSGTVFSSPGTELM